MSTAMVKLKEESANENKTRSQTNRLWVDVEAPVEKRVVKSFLSSFRFQLIEWKFSRESVSFDVDSGTLKVEGKDVVKAGVDGDELRLTWLDSTWGGWDLLQKSNELEAILKLQNGRLASSRANKSKVQARAWANDGAYGTQTQFHPMPFVWVSLIGIVGFIIFQLEHLFVVAGTSGALLI
jgi:hypothetical protein